MAYTFKPQINRVHVIEAARKFMESIWHLRVMYKNNEKCIKQQISRKLKKENNLKIANMTAKR